ncbi:MAG TPA: DUF4157 domain-containing protein [Blastocatellia bacterium]|nr:DUF4157 domain-containing protein [Blastocatellia bacterium]
MKVSDLQKKDEESKAIAKAEPQPSIVAQPLQSYGLTGALLNIQRTHGNRFVQRMLNESIIQRKCACGSQAEMSGECARCNGESVSLQRHSTGESESVEVPAIVHEVLRSPGHSLDAAMREYMEPRFGYDFGQVRVHTDAKAAESAAAVEALAYTVGHNVVFGTGQYAPGTSAGRHLLAHELTHVIQQGGSSAAPQAKLVISEPQDAEERMADHVANIISKTIFPGEATHSLNTKPRQARSIRRGVSSPILQIARSKFHGVKGKPTTLIEAIRDQLMRAASDTAMLREMFEIASEAEAHYILGRLRLKRDGKPKDDEFAKYFHAHKDLNDEIRRELLGILEEKLSEKSAPQATPESPDKPAPADAEESSKRAEQTRKPGDAASSRAGQGNVRVAEARTEEEGRNRQALIAQALLVVDLRAEQIRPLFQNNEDLLAQHNKLMEHINYVLSLLKKAGQGTMIDTSLLYSAEFGLDLAGVTYDLMRGNREAWNRNLPNRKEIEKEVNYALINYAWAGMDKLKADPYWTSTSRSEALEFLTKATSHRDNVRDVLPITGIMQAGVMAASIASIPATVVTGVATLGRIAAWMQGLRIQAATLEFAGAMAGASTGFRLVSTGGSIALTQAEVLALVKTGVISTTALDLYMMSTGGSAGGPPGPTTGSVLNNAGTVTVETSIKNGLVNQGGKLFDTLSGIQREFVAKPPKNSIEALNIVERVTKALKLGPGVQTEGSIFGEYVVLQNVGGILTKILKSGEIIVTRGTDLLLRLIP